MNHNLWLLMLLPLTFFSFQIKNPGTSETTIVVSPDGDDGQSGTPEAPLKTLTAALEQVAATLAEDSNTDVAVRLRAGTYYLTETLRLTPAAFAHRWSSTYHCALPGRTTSRFRRL